jgi:acyl dehydratase
MAAGRRAVDRKQRPETIMKSLPYYFEDFEENESFSTVGMTLTEDAITRFAMEWDFQEFHIDRQAAEHSIFGGLIASGLHVLSLSFRLYNELGLMRGTALAGLGISELRWVRPAYAGDSLRVVATILNKRRTKNPDRGLIVVRLTTFNQTDDLLMTGDISCLVKCRNSTTGVPGPEAAG